MECRCTHIYVLHGTEAEEYAAEHLRSGGGEQQVLRQIDPAQHLTRRPQS